MYRSSSAFLFNEVSLTEERGSVRLTYPQQEASNRHQNSATMHASTTLPNLAPPWKYNIYYLKSEYMTLKGCNGSRNRGESLDMSAKRPIPLIVEKYQISLGQ